MVGRRKYVLSRRPRLRDFSMGFCVATLVTGALGGIAEIAARPREIARLGPVGQCVGSATV